MNRISVSVLLVPVVLLAAGCVASTPESRIARHREDFARLPESAQHKIRAGEVDVGFTEDMVLLALGKPGRRFKRTDDKGASEVWVYYRSQPHVSVGFGMSSGGYGGVATGISMSTAGNPDDEFLRVIFDDGKVVTIEKVVR
jgi:hypothetical protein